MDVKKDSTGIERLSIAEDLVKAACFLRVSQGFGSGIHRTGRASASQLWMLHIHDVSPI